MYFTYCICQNLFELQVQPFHGSIPYKIGPSKVYSLQLLAIKDKVDTVHMLTQCPYVNMVPVLLSSAGVLDKVHIDDIQVAK